MDYELTATIIGVFLALLFLLYDRSKKRNVKDEPRKDQLQNPYEGNSNSSVNKPDLISRTAGGIVKAHHLFNQIMAFIFAGVVLIMAVYEPLVRIIVISTIVLMVIIALVWKACSKRR